MADHAIVIDARLNAKAANAQLKILQQQAKATAQQIGKVGKEAAAAESKKLKLADDLRQAQAEADKTAAALEEVNARLEAARHSRFGLSDDNPDIANNAKLTEQLDQQDAKVEAANQKYTQQAEIAAKLVDTQKQLTAQLEQQNALVDKQTAAAQFSKADSDFQSYFDKQRAAIEKEYAKTEARQTREFGSTSEDTSATAHAEQVVRETQAEIAAQEKAAKAASKHAEAEKSLGKAQDSTAGSTKRASGHLSAASKSLGHFGTRLKRIVAGALIFNVISAGLRTLTNSLGSAISQTDGFQSALGRLKGAAATAAAPLVNVLGSALTYIMNLAAKAFAYVAKLISLLTGKSLSAMQATAKKMTSVGTAASGTAKQTDKATKSLAGFDEIERLDKKDDSSSGGSGSTPATFGALSEVGDVSGITNAIDSIKAAWQRFTDALAPSAEAWSAAWEQIKAAAAAALPQLEASFTNLWQNGLVPLFDYFVFDFVPGFVNGLSLLLAPVVGDVVSTVITTGTAILSALANMLTDSINTWIIPALDLVKQIWLDLCTSWNTAWTTYISPVFTMFAEMIQDTCDWLQKLWIEYIDPIIANIIAEATALWNEHLQPLCDDIIAVVGGAVNIIATVIKAFWDNYALPLANWLLDTFGPVFVDVFAAISAAVSTAIGWVVDELDIGLIALRGLIDFLRNVFAGNWEAAWQSIGDATTRIVETAISGIKSAINGILRVINNMISGAIGTINGLISGVNKLGSIAGFSIPTLPSAVAIPYLAQGAVIPANKEFLAVLGDQTSGTNIEAPLATIEEAVANVMQDMQAGQMAGFETVAALLRELLEAVYGIELTDDQIGRAAQRWQNRRAVATGGV